MYPFAWLISASLKPRGEVFDNALFPKTLQLENYAKVWDELPLLHWLGNSIVIALLAAGFVAISSSVVAFGFAYFKFPGRTLLFGLGAGHDDAARRRDVGAAVPDLEEHSASSAPTSRCGG